MGSCFGTETLPWTSSSFEQSHLWNKGILLALFIHVVFSLYINSYITMGSKGESLVCKLVFVALLLGMIAQLNIVKDTSVFSKQHKMN